MYLKFFLLLVFMNLNLYAQPGIQELWSLGGSMHDECNEVKMDSKGNLVLLGLFNDEIDIDPGQDVKMIKSKGEQDVVVLKLDPTGKLLWYYQFGGVKNEIALSLSLDALDQIYVTGNFEDEIALKSSFGDVVLKSTGMQDAFIFKLNEDGLLHWARQWGGIREDFTFSITTNLHNETFIAGYFTDSMMVKVKNQDQNIISNGGKDIFVAKIDRDGFFSWIHTYGSKTDDIATKIMDYNSNIITYGAIYDTIDFDPGPAELLLGRSSKPTAYILSLNTDGEIHWVKGLSGDNSIFTSGGKVDYNGNILLTGFFTNKVDMDPGSEVYELSSYASSGDIFICKLDSNGNYTWAKQFGGNYHDVGLDVAVDKLNNIYFTGCYEFGADFDPGPRTKILFSDSTDKNNAFVCKLNSHGELQWAKEMYGKIGEVGLSIFVDKQDRIYNTGVFSDQTNFDHGITNHLLTSHGESDMYIMILDPLISSEKNKYASEKNSFYPNPARNYIIVSGDEEIIEVNIRDLNGRSIFEIMPSKTESDKMINIELLGSGLYQLILSTKYGSKSSLLSIIK